MSFANLHWARWVLLLVCCGATCLAGAQLPVPTGGDSAAPRQDRSTPQKTSAGDMEYVISPDDVLDVYILDVPEMSRQYRVSPTGSIAFPLISDRIPAAGLTLEEFSEHLGHRLQAEGLVSNPHISVSVQQSRLHSVAISGAVRHPQIYPIMGRTTLLDVISQAEGLTDDAGNVALIQRGEIGARAMGIRSDLSPAEREAALTQKVDLTDLISGGAGQSANVEIHPGDRIVVPRAGIIYVVGAVNRPGGFNIKPSRQGLTILQAVALAENLKSTAVPRKAVLLRADPQAPEGRKSIPLDLNRVMAGKAPDQPLRAEDILFVPDSTTKKAFRRGIESVLQVATGVAIYRR